MYAAHFGLKILPFENVPDPAFFFNEGEYQRVLRRLTAAVEARRGLMVVAGPIGSGKTMLSQKLMSELPEKTLCLWLAEPPGTAQELFTLLQRKLYCTAVETNSRILTLGVLRDRLLELQASGGHFLLVVDESHKFTDEGLEAIRMLNNLEQGASKLMQVLLLGQTELVEMLSQSGREAFRQRIANLEVLGRMTPAQVHSYILHRVCVAGGEAAIFPDFACDAVAETAGGIPRLINSLCDRALMHACDSASHAVEAGHLLQAAEEVGLYRKAFQYLVDRQPGEMVRPTTQLPPSPMPAPAIVLTPVPAIASSEPRRPARTKFLGTLVFFGGGMAALAMSLAYYCVRASKVYDGNCLAHLAGDLLP